MDWRKQEVARRAIDNIDQRRRTLGKNNTKGGTPPTHTQPTQQVTPSSETWCCLILLSKICKSGIYSHKFKNSKNTLAHLCAPRNFYWVWRTFISFILKKISWTNLDSVATRRLPLQCWVNYHRLLVFTSLFDWVSPICEVINDILWMNEYFWNNHES